MAFEIKSKVKHKTLDGLFQVIATKETPYDGRGASPFNTPIKVKPDYDYKIVQIKEDGSFSAFIDAKEDDLIQAT